MSGAPTIESNGIELKAKLNPDFATVVSPMPSSLLLNCIEPLSHAVKNSSKNESN